MDNSELIRRVSADVSYESGPHGEMVVTLECITPSGDEVRLPLSADCALTLLNRMRTFERRDHRTDRRNVAPSQSALNVLSAPMDGAGMEAVT